MEKREEGCHTQQSLPSHPILYEVTEKRKWQPGSIIPFTELQQLKPTHYKVHFKVFNILSPTGSNPVFLFCVFIESETQLYSMLDLSCSLLFLFYRERSLTLTRGEFGSLPIRLSLQPCGNTVPFNITKKAILRRQRTLQVSSKHIGLFTIEQ